MQLPHLCTNQALAALAAPDETTGMRVVIRRVSNLLPYTLRGKTRQYLAEYHHELRAHVIDVPTSVWMHDCQVAPYSDNASVAHDLQGNRNPMSAPLVFLIIPWPGAGTAVKAPVEQSDAPSPLDALRALAADLGAPELLLSAIDLVASDRPSAEVVNALDVTRASLETTEPEKSKVQVKDPETGRLTTPAAIRMRNMRARKKAGKVAAKKVAKKAAKKLAANATLETASA